MKLEVMDQATISNILKSTTRSRTTEHIPVALLRDAPFNPPSRIDDIGGAINALGEDIKTNGQREPVHAVRYPNGTYVLGDGHRRKAGAKAAGLLTLEAWVYDPGTSDAEQVLRALYVDLNEKKRRLANRDMTEVAIAGGPVFDSNVLSTATQLKEMFPAGLPTIVQQNAGSYLLSVAKATVKYCWSGLDKKTPQFREKTALTLLWLIRNKQQQAVTAYRRLGFSPEKLRNAIAKNKVTPRVGAAVG